MKWQCPKCGSKVRHPCRIPQKTRSNVCKDYKKGMTYAGLAEWYKISRTSVYQIIKEAGLV